LTREQRRIGEENDQINTDLARMRPRRDELVDVIAEFCSIAEVTAAADARLRPQQMPIEDTTYWAGDRQREAAGHIAQVRGSFGNVIGGMANLLAQMQTAVANLTTEIDTLVQRQLGLDTQFRNNEIALSRLP